MVLPTCYSQCSLLTAPYLEGGAKLSLATRNGYWFINDTTLTRLSAGARLKETILAIILIIPIVNHVVFAIMQTCNMSMGYAQWWQLVEKATSSTPPAVPATKFAFYTAIDDLALHKAPSWVRNCKPLVIKAINLNIETDKLDGGKPPLHFASKELQGDLEVAQAAVTCNAHSFEDVSIELRSNKEFVLFALDTQGKHSISPWSVVHNMDKALLSDKDVMVAAMKADSYLPRTLFTCE